MKIIAEISCNHNGSIDRAIDTINLIYCDYVKFQTWKPGTMAVPYYIKHGPWQGIELTSLYEQAHTPWEWHERLFNHARERGLTPFSTPFDKPSVDFLETLDCPIYKIASFELADLELIDYVAQTGKPIIMSTGVSEANEIRAAVNTARKHLEDITLLHCVSEYPTTLESANLRTMAALKRFNCKIGLSDHSLGPTVALAATALGATVIEKHVTISNEGLDKDFAMRPNEFNAMVRTCIDVEKAMGVVKFGGDDTFKRSLYYSQNIEEGSIITKDHIKTARPNLGLSPMRISEVIGTNLKYSVKKNDPVQI